MKIDLTKFKLKPVARGVVTSVSLCELRIPGARRMADCCSCVSLCGRGGGSFTVDSLRSRLRNLSELIA